MTSISGVNKNYLKKFYFVDKLADGSHQKFYGELKKLRAAAHFDLILGYFKQLTLCILVLTNSCIYY